MKKYKELNLKELYPQVKTKQPYCYYWCDTPKNWMPSW